MQRGAVCCLLGRNGAGKTTLLKLLLGLLRPTAGSASILGLDSIRDRPALLRQTGSLIETPAFYDHLSAAENRRCGRQSTWSAPGWIV
nr:ATP-binding cassette domain-containing protein [Faecalibacterium sp. An58]